jgi:hypothetical protein
MKQIEKNSNARYTHNPGGIAYLHPGKYQLPRNDKAVQTTLLQCSQERRRKVFSNA